MPATKFSNSCAIFAYLVVLNGSSQIVSRNCCAFLSFFHPLRIALSFLLTFSPYLLLLILMRFLIEYYVRVSLKIFQDFNLVSQSLINLGHIDPFDDEIILLFVNS